MVEAWSSVAPLLWTPSSTRASPPNLPSLIGWEVHKVWGRLEIRRVKGVQSRPPFLFFLSFQISQHRAKFSTNPKQPTFFFKKKFIHNFGWSQVHPSKNVFIHILDVGFSSKIFIPLFIFIYFSSKIGWKVFIHLWFSTSHNFHIRVQILMIFSSLDSS